VLLLLDASTKFDFKSRAKKIVFQLNITYWGDRE